ncbi:group-specific protein [Paenibacillus macquariensis]|uniref:Group-specific protein n=1 Tax=Paenibacillus macquariensis TaxID=948756 RepID=A0ABY1JM80_9BACL|nr:group-specific protein [Paenibacillus macquariensis]MEC0090618.1 group-specific protein [Paenibacillus macquariensis]OAB25036.1 group-specific protein [Paenibacillus macquariensis subsp. macquariensis]SIQ45068.1 hypothetical protein SAMN05421578_10247 [Paenibacillus macquariensis]
MGELITVTIDQEEVLKICRERINTLIKEVEAEYIFWDAKELKKRTCMSWNTIQNTFFFDPRFVKHKVGSKWYFPVQETREFLAQWLREQSVGKY